FSRRDGERYAIDDGRTAIPLGEALRVDDGHRRPNRATAPTMTRRATPMMPAPAMPHMVDVVTVMRKFDEADSPREVARTVVTWPPAIALAAGVTSAWTSWFWPAAMRSIVFGSNVIFQPFGPEPDSSIWSAGAVPELVIRIGIVVSTPAVARADTRPSRPVMSSFGWPVISSTTSVFAVTSSAAARMVTGKRPAPMVLGGRTFSFTSLDWPASIGTALSSWLP